MIDELNDGMVNQQAEMPVEKTLTQSQVNEIVKREKAQAAERARQEAMAQFSQQQQQQAPMQSNLPPMSEEMIRRMMAEEMGRQNAENERRMREQQQAERNHRIANSFLGKMEHGKQYIPDFDSVVDMQDLQHYPEIVELVEPLDNAAEVIYDLLNNKGKLANIMTLAARDYASASVNNGRGSQMARKEIQKLSESIKRNEQAANQKQPNPPLGQIKSSSIANGNDENQSVEHLRSMDWARF